MNIAPIAQVIDLFAMSFVLGATAWFFFVQSPVLLKKLGREKFVPLQMRLTVVLFKVLTAALLIMLGATALANPIAAPITIAAGVALLGGLINQFVVVPRALRAGGQSRKDIKGKDHEGSTPSFASEGAGNKTKWMHRLVVLFVVVMLGGIFTHGVALLGC
jgi:hypothetical protein